MEPMSDTLLFVKHCFAISESEKIVFSPFLKNILRIVSSSDHKGKLQYDVYLYSVDKSTGNDGTNVSLIYNQQYFGSPSFIFSEDGKQLLICTDNCIYFLWIDESGVHEKSSVTLSELYKTCNIFKTDFVSYDVEPVQLKNNSVTLCINRHWLLDFHPTLSLNYCMQIINDVSHLQHTKDKVFCLTSYGKIFSYNICDGLLSSSFDVYSVLPNTVHLKTFTVNNNNHQIALYDGSRSVYILHIPEHEDCESVKSHLTSVSHTSTFSRAESVRSVNCTKSKSQTQSASSPSTWLSYLDRLSLQNKEERSVTEQTFICIKDLPENTIVEKIQFYSCSSVGIWCVTADSDADNFYRVYDRNSGELEMSRSVHPHVRVIPLNCAGISFDVFAGPSTLSLPLLFTSKEAVVNKLLSCVGSDCVTWLLELDKSLSQSMQPLSLLNDGLKDSQLHLVRLSLNLHFQELKRELNSKVIETTKTFMDQMIAVANDPFQRESFSHKVLLETLMFANKVLPLLKSNSSLKYEILKRVVHLRCGIRKQQLLPIEGTLITPTWSTWELLSDKEILKDSVKDLPLAHCFLILRRHWSPEDISGKKFKQLVISVVIDFLMKENLREAQEFLIQSGFEPMTELALMCKNTLNRSLRDYLMSTLAEGEADALAEAWKFIRVVESILDRYTITNPFMDSPLGLLTLSNVMSYSLEMKTHILTDLYYSTQDSTLKKYLQRDVCWDYLLSYNCSEVIDLVWPVTQDMIDRVDQEDVAGSTKETLLNRLVSDGMFLSSEKCSCQAVITRLACCKLLLQYKDIVKTSTIDLDKAFMVYAVKHDLLDIVIRSSHSLHPEQVQKRPSWFSMWNVFVDWDKKGIVELLTETNNYLAQDHMSLYLRKHPLVAIATNLSKHKEISRTDAYFSPVISSITAADPLLSDMTVYSFLAGTVPFYTDNLFQFQPDQNRMLKEFVIQMPDFTSEELCKKYGRNQRSRFIDCLKQGRPCEAVVQLFDQSGRIAAQTKKHACSAAHGLALYYNTDSVITTSCVAFFEMLGRDSNLLRTHLASSVILQKNTRSEQQHLRSQLYKALFGIVEELFKEIEHTLKAQWEEEQNTLLCLHQNQLAICLAASHGLPPSYMVLKFAASSNDWLLFVLAAQVFQYSLTKVQELVAEFTCNQLQEHLCFALGIEPIKQCEMGSIATGSLGTTKVKAGLNSSSVLWCKSKSELFANISQCNNIAEEMLNMSIKFGNPVLAILAPSLKPKSGISPFCTWLVSSMQVSVSLSEPWTPDKVLKILELAVQLNYIQVLAQAILIFLPESPLQIFLTFLVDTVLDKKFHCGTTTLKAFKTACMSLPEKMTGRIIGFMKNKTWIGNAASTMASVALVYCFKSVYHQNRYLQVLADSHLSVTAPDYTLILRLSTCLAHTDISLDYAQLCLNNDCSQLTQLLQLLIDRKDFQTAFRFASTAGLSLSPVHIAEWSERAKTDEGVESGFWDRCQTALNQALVNPQMAAEFFKKQATLIHNPEDRFVVLKYALEWMGKQGVQDKYLKKEENIQLDMYLTVLQQGFKIKMVTEGMTYTPLHYLTADLKRKRQSQDVPILSVEQHYKLDSLIHGLLEVGDIMTVVILQDMFQHNNQDYELVFACLSLAEGKPVQQLPEMIQDLLSNDTSSPRYIHKKNSGAEQQKLLNHLYALQVHQTCATPLFRNIINAYKVSSRLGIDFKTVLTHPEPLSLLKVEDDFEMAGYIFTLVSLTDSELTQYLAEQLISVIHAGPVENKYFLWGCDLDAQFGRLLSLDGIIPLMLGNLLLSSVPRLDSKRPIKLGEAVELLIRSHNCFTKACNMEGISSILTMAKDLVNLLLDCCQWAFMVRLLTGVGRYTEMKYIFQILKDRDQFEFLLGKGLNKYPGLMSAMLDFVRNDKSFYMLVAVHFCMYSELAAFFKEEASYELEKLDRGQDGSLVNSHHNKRCLQTALNKLADATNHYIQANKQKQGVVCVQQAELVALQLSLMTTSLLSHSVHCLINLSPDQVNALIVSSLSYEEACIVSTAYNLTVDWSAALYYHCVVQGDTSYLNAWCQHNQFTMTIVQDVARRFQNSNTTETNMKWFLSSVNQVDIKYRICSLLGFKDLLQTILSGPDLAYLKDTVWQRGFKYSSHHL